MAEEIKITEEETTEGNTFLAGVRRVLMAGVGAVALAQEEAEDFVNNLVERGEIAEKDGRKLVNELVEKRRSKAEESAENLSSEMDKRMENLLKRMNIPTKADIDELSKKVATLTRKVDDLKKSK